MADLASLIDDRLTAIAQMEDGAQAAKEAQEFWLYLQEVRERALQTRVQAVRAMKRQTGLTNRAVSQILGVASSTVTEILRGFDIRSNKRKV